MEHMPTDKSTHGKQNKCTQTQKNRDGKDYRQIIWGDFIVNQLSVLPSVSGRIMLGGELKGWEVTRIRAHSKEQEEQDGHKRRRMTKPSEVQFLDRLGFVEWKLWPINNVQAYFVEAVPTNYKTLKPLYVLCCTVVPPLITPGETAQAENSKFPADTVCVITGTLQNQVWGESALFQAMRRHCTGPISCQ